MPLLHLKWLSKEEEMKSCEENDILVIKIADSLFGKTPRIVKLLLMPGEGKAVRNSVGAYDVRILIVSLKASPSLESWEPDVTIQNAGI